MNFEEYMKTIHGNLSKTAKVYIETIIEKYYKYIPKEKLRQLKSINDYGDIVFIESYGSINGFANNKGVHVPLDAYPCFEKFRNLKEYGTIKDHVLCDNENIVLNDNTFADYVDHLIYKGSNIEDYYNDLLLHEIMHFCGIGGGSALREGINEYLTRKLAKEKEFITSGCGYPKETKIAYEVEQIFEEEIFNKIAFAKDEKEILCFLEKKLGKKASDFYDKISREMEIEFSNKYYKKINSYNGLYGIKQKIDNYDKINYTEVYKIINEYKNKMDNVKK